MALVAEAPERAEDSTQPLARRKPRRLRRRLMIALLVILVPLCVAGVWVKFTFDRVEREALRLAETGVSLNKFLKTYVAAVKDKDIDALMTLHDDDYASEREGLWQLNLQSDRDGVQVYAWESREEKFYGKADVRRQLELHLASHDVIESAKFKISSIEEMNDDGLTKIRAVLWLRGSTAEYTKLQSHTTFRLTLSSDDHGGFKIRGKQMLFGQTVVGNGTGFTDITQSAGIKFESHHNPMLNEPQWRPNRFGIMKYATAGVATADYDGDGWYDIYFCDGENPCLYRNKRDGTFEDVTSQAGLPVGLQGTHVAIFADFDNDPLKTRDLFLGRGTGKNFLFRNNGDGTFTDVTEGANVAGLWVSTASAADYNNDGLIDLYVGRYLDPRVDLPSTNFYTRNGQGNTLLRNDGNFKFTDVTDEAGVREGGLSLGIAWGDYDADGDQDVYVANDFGRNALFRNNGNGTFTDVSKESGTVDLGYGMSASFEDVNGDGRLDLYVSNVHSGQRWFGNTATLQRYFVTSIQEGTIFEDYPLYKEIYDLVGLDPNFGENVIRGNSLMLNNGDGTFTDVTETSKVNPHGWYWSSAVCDFDNDALLDIYTVNGWVSYSDPTAPDL
ncbi:MAG TPA: VCBS repeat-containing protein [Pirellulaceae bacterium]|nr:VCBS repeat-containing protein [Pirellulaceae bacterium]